MAPGAAGWLMIRWQGKLPGLPLRRPISEKGEHMQFTTTSSPVLSAPSSAFADEPQVVAAHLNILLADAFALYLKTKSFHWHVSGPNFRDYHLLLDEQASEIFAMTDVIAERVRKLGSPTLKSIGNIQRLQRVADNENPHVDAQSLLSELLHDNRQFVHEMIEVHQLCDRERDVATASILENYIDEGERRVWFLREVGAHLSAAL
jgi:starvation-inducible DNA-binding protein